MAAAMPSRQSAVGEELMDYEEVDFLSGDLPDYYFEIPLRALQITTRHEICLHLDVQKKVNCNDWRMLAEKLGCRMIQIDNWMNKDSPTQAVLTHAMREDVNLGAFINIIRDLERPDVIEAIQDLVDRDAKKYQPVQVQEVSSNGRLPITIGELNTGEIEYFDAFVSVHPIDYPFLQELITTIEDEQGFKLCIPDRDMLIGSERNDDITKLITSRCKRVIIVLSNTYVNVQPDDNEGLNKKWQMIFAQAYAPIAQKMHKLVPVVIEPEVVVPHILIPYNASDYSREATRQWFWNRLIASLDAPTNGGGGYDGPISPSRLGRNINAGHSTMRSHPSARRSQGSRSRRAPRTTSEPIDMAPSRVRSDSDIASSSSAGTGGSSDSSNRVSNASLHESFELSGTHTDPTPPDSRINSYAQPGSLRLSPPSNSATQNQGPNKRWPFNNNNNQPK